MFARRTLMAFRPAPPASRDISTTGTTRFASNTASTRFTRARPSIRTTWQTISSTCKPQVARPFSRSSTTSRQAFNYRRFKATSSLFQRWAARPTFYYEVAGIGGFAGGIYIYNLEAVPVSGRRRFNVVGPDTEKSMAGQMYAQVMNEYQGKIMSEGSKEVRMVRRVLKRLLPHSGLGEEEGWEVNVINDEQKNAFVIPGGKVFVFRGILDVCQGEDGLAAVLGHEIAHNVAHHAAERMSQSGILLLLALAGSFLIGVDPGIGQYVTKLAFELPGSRKQEEEADYIGLLMMAESCYDPSAAMGLWSRMEQEEKNMTAGRGAPPQFLSTHPSSHNRLEKIRDWLPQAEDKLRQSDCGMTAGYARDFGHQVEEFARWR